MLPEKVSGNSEGFQRKEVFLILLLIQIFFYQFWLLTIRRQYYELLQVIGSENGKLF